MSNQIFIVDDSPITQKQLIKIVKDAGYNVSHTASTGKEAISIFDSNQGSIDLITLDITMPELDGISVLKHIMSKAPETNVIMISVIGKESVIKECMDLGAKFFITKPFVKEKVLEIIKDCLESES